ncbi:MAG: hypothetical protein BroJett003_22740 [Planctomycetota bacterium]|nr:MAG: hypothetical protein BroJett003_22740 [Planctomycetota bacterium]
MPLIPIRTESPVKRKPWANIALIALNALVFAVHALPLGGWSDRVERAMALQTLAPATYQFLTYQFAHANLTHLLGNLVFLWVFGNSVNGKLGHGPYVLFYLAGGVFAALGYAWLDDQGTVLIGASGAIAAVTTAYLVLFPRSHVLILSLVVLIGVFRIPAMILILVKIILWDNVVAQWLDPDTRVAHEAHLAGYLFGFVAGLALLAARAVARDHYDLLSLWDRAHRRFIWRKAVAEFSAPQRGLDGRIIPKAVAQARSPETSAALDRIAEVRERIREKLASGDVTGACDAHQMLVSIDPQQCLSEREQLLIARGYYAQGRMAQAAAAFERFLATYRDSSEASGVALLLGIIQARDLANWTAAWNLLSAWADRMPDAAREAQLRTWLAEARRRLNDPDDPRPSVPRP